MKRLIYEGIAVLVCVVSGCLMGYGIHGRTDIQNHKKEQETKDNTLIREEYDSVFFVGENRDVPEEEGTEPVKNDITPTKHIVPTLTGYAVPSEIPEDYVSDVTPSKMPEIFVDTMSGTLSSEAPTNTPVPAAEETPETSSGKMPTLMTVLPLVTVPAPVSPIVTAVPTPAISAAPTSAVPDERDKTVITYPSEIFGQTPMVNREDSYVTYFEFALDLITVLEPEMKQTGKNEMTLFAEFMVKALFCGLDIQKVKLNDPIPRDVAALGMHLAAQVLDKPGIETSAGMVQDYASDVKNCTSAEKKAIAYLYKQDILRVSQERKFYPDAALSEKNVTVWLSGAKKVWQ